MADGRDIVISAAAAERILRLRDGRAALYYLHLLCGGGASVESTARALGWSESETLAAQAALSAAGVLPKGEIEAEIQPPSYSSVDLTNKLEGDPAFAALITYTQMRMNRTLSPADTAKLLEIYDHLGMPAGEMMLLISWCVSRERQKKGDAARVAMWTIEREAHRWLNEGIDTEDKAEQYIRHLEAREADIERLKTALQIRGRELTASERRYLEKWSASGLQNEAIYKAYDRTVIATGSLKWAYMDRIIEDWMQNGVPDDTETKPSNTAQKPTPRRQVRPSDGGEDAAELRRRRQQKESDER